MLLGYREPSQSVLLHKVWIIHQLWFSQFPSSLLRWLPSGPLGGCVWAARGPQAAFWIVKKRKKSSNLCTLHVFRSTIVSFFCVEKKNSWFSQKCLCLLCFLALLELNTEKIMRSRHDSEDKCWASFWLQQLVSFAKYLSLYLETPAVLGIGCQSIRCEEESQLFFFFFHNTGCEDPSCHTFGAVQQHNSAHQLLFKSHSVIQT